MTEQESRATELTEQLRKLDTERKAYETEIVALCEVLDAPGMPGMHGKLIDNEGFPIPDVDLHQVKSMRGRIAYLNTDLSGAMKQIETLLAELHSLNKVEGGE